MAANADRDGLVSPHGFTNHCPLAMETVMINAVKNRGCQLILSTHKDGNGVERDILYISDLNLSTMKTCPNCLSSDSFQYRIKPKMKLTLSLKKIIKKAKLNSQQLSKRQKNLYQLYCNSQNKVITTCKVCKKSIDKQNGVTRQDWIQKKNLLHQQHKDSSDKPTIIHRPNSTARIEPSTSSKTNQNTSILPPLKTKNTKKRQKIQHQSLQYMLSLEKRRTNNLSGSLKDFLSSVK